MREIGVGIIGFGFMGKMHTYGYKTIPLYYSDLPYKIRLVGVCNRTRQKAETARETLDFAFATDDEDEIINHPDIEVINICTPNLYHKDAVIKALQKRKHIYCDKPLAVNYQEAEEIVAHLDQAGVITQMAMNYRFFPATIRAKELIDEGRLGKVISFQVSYLHSGSVDPGKPLGWKQEKRFGGGVLLDLGSHVLDLIYYFLGEISAVFAETQILYGKRPDQEGKMVEVTAEDAVYMILKLKNGATGMAAASKIATGTEDELRFELYGTKGALRFNLMQPNWLEYFDHTQPETPFGGFRGFTKIECGQKYEKPGGVFPSPKVAIGWTRAHVHSLYNFLQCVDAGIPAAPSLYEGAYIQYIMEKVAEAAQKQKWITLS